MSFCASAVPYWGALVAAQANVGVGGTSILPAVNLGVAQDRLTLKSYYDASSGTAKASGKFDLPAYQRRHYDAFRGMEGSSAVDASPARDHSDVQVAAEDGVAVRGRHLAVVAKDPNHRMGPSLCLSVILKSSTLVTR